MTNLDQARAALEGGEFDWLLVDAVGAIAVCEAARFGEVPDVVLALGANRLDAYSDAVPAVLSSVPENGACSEENGDVGHDTETLGYGRRGLYVYDWEHWSGPYRRIVVPEHPIDVKALGPALGGFRGAVPRVGVESARTGGFQLPELLPMVPLKLDGSRDEVDRG